MTPKYVAAIAKWLGMFAPFRCTASRATVPDGRKIARSALIRSALVEVRLLAAG